MKRSIRRVMIIALLGAAGGISAGAVVRAPVAQAHLEALTHAKMHATQVMLVGQTHTKKPRSGKADDFNAGKGLRTVPNPHLRIAAKRGKITLEIGPRAALEAGRDGKLRLIDRKAKKSRDLLEFLTTDGGGRGHDPAPFRRLQPTKESIEARELTKRPSVEMAEAAARRQQANGQKVVIKGDGLDETGVDITLMEADIAYLERELGEVRRELQQTRDLVDRMLIELQAR